ncbi:multiheme c-type cytochrome [Desulfocurvibacter africanus]|uniref:Uncharacterized protein n=1 Tax=Desulfocurvibacter africanus subsp. africanus str. Walvis Bay TaxID=690850 RepID=F3YV44_DESAF|nr:multiheme c-type cytochrome [Desulfocurvibacter africanus]EGJ49294.1 hypothetical protein Desaf_0946 [Desulfocurvibacter africanus subsp. africanus str. Walvis Bay]
MNRLAFSHVMPACLALAVLMVLAAVPAQSAQKDQGSPKQAVDQGSNCVQCHKRETPNIVTDWSLSKHAANGVDCKECHGGEHTSAKDTQEAVFATPEVCQNCHEEQVAQYQRGKHALAWVSVNAMPTTHYQPMALLQGLEGCTGCHVIGIKDEETARSLQKQGVRYGLSSCDSCHTRHTFSTLEASQPQACRTCHMGFDHPQWEMWESSKHGVRYLLKQDGVLPPEASAPKCQTCHMPQGDHGVMTAWGFLAVRLPMPENKQWAEDRTTILKGFGVLDPQGKPTARLEAVKAAKLARLTQEEWQQQRDKMLAVCAQCHSEGFARNELHKGDEMIRESDALLADSIRVVAKLYQDGVLRKPKNYAYAYPDLLTFQDAPTMIETRLWLMFLKHRMRTFQGSFHQNPDYTFWYGWSEMIQDQNAIREMAQGMRRDSGKTAGGKGQAQ